MAEIFQNEKELGFETKEGDLFYEGAQFPPADEIERLAKYKRGKYLFEGKHYELFHRAQALLQKTPFNEQLKTLYMAVNILDVIVTKPSDLMFGEPPTYESGLNFMSQQQKRINSIVEENNLNLLGQEVVTSAGYRGDSFIKTYFDYRNDYSELGFIPTNAKMEAIIEAQDPSTVFPELARGSRKKFKAINIAWVEWVENARGEETAYLNIERHLTGYIQYYRYRLIQNGVEGYSTVHGVGIETFTIAERVPTGKPSDIVETGVDGFLIHHIPYKTTDDSWQGISSVEKVETLIGAINDRLVQIDYILFKHSDPTIYGVPLDEIGDEVRFGGKYIPVRKDDVAPQYMTWDSQLDGAFRELDILIGLVYQISETPQWLFGTTLSQDKGGTGTSHTDGSAIKARFMPILSKVKRIRSYVDIAIRDALYTAQILDNVGNAGVDGFTSYDAVYPKITWRDGIPEDEKTLAEVMQLRTGGKPTLDVMSAIKRLDDMGDEHADEILRRISDDEKRDAFVNPSVFNTNG